MQKFNLLVICCSGWDLSQSKHLFENISKELFDLYLTADNKILGCDIGACEQLNIDLENAIEIISPTDPKLQNLDAIITVGIGA
jgi:hypothetical protein